MVRLGVLGTGSIASEVIPRVTDWGYEVTALCGTKRSEEKVKEWCEKFQIPSGYTDFGQMLADGCVDAVYIAVPNHLHAAFARQALEAGVHVIVEKPFTSNDREAEELDRLAREKGLCLFEAISTIYLPNFKKIQELLPRIGQVKIVMCNYSQYSRRYDAFQAGEVLPAFDPAKSGGALMDLNLYNLHYLIGLFGRPNQVSYQANVERGIDTSGVITLQYDTFQAVSIAAKDCAAPCIYTIQGTKGYITQNTPANWCYQVTLHLNDGTEEVYQEHPEKPADPSARLEPEFRFFARAIETGDTAACYERLEHTLTVSRVQTQARHSAGIQFAADEP